MSKSFSYAFIAVLLATLAFRPLFAQQLRPGEWRSFLTQADNRQVIATNSGYLLRSDVGISYYDASFQEVFSLDPLGTLNGQRTQLMAFDSTNGRHFLAYTDGRIDYFTQPDDIGEILDLFVTTNFSDKTINQLFPVGDTLLIATNFGLLLYDIARGETRGTYVQIGELSEPVAHQVALTADSLFVLVNSGVFAAPRSGANLADGANWRESLFFSTPGSFRAMRQTNDGIYVLNDNRIQFRDPQTGWRAVTGELSNSNTVYDFGSNATFAWCHIQDTLFILRNGVSTIETSGFVTSNYSFSGNGRHLIHKNWDESVELIDRPSGVSNRPLENLFPPTNRGRHVRVQDDKLYITANFRSGTAPSYEAIGVSEYTFATAQTPAQWRQFSAGLNLPNDFYSATLPFVDSRRNLWIGSFDQGVVQLKATGELEVFNGDNSPLVGIFPDPAGGWIATRITDIIEDQQGILWMTLYAADQDRSLVAHDPETGQWQLFRLPEGWTYELTQDLNGYIWIRNWRNGVTVYDYNRTPFDASDDRSRVMSTGDLSGGLSNSVVQDVVVDRDGYVWVASSAGVVVYYNTFNAFDASVSTDASCPVFERRCLLENFQVNAIAVDGANNKYFGTEGGGVYYFSEDASEELAHYTTENSPLISDNVTDLAINPATGELFIATDAGVVSYQADATTPVEIQPESDQALELFAFPNPYKPAEHEQLTVRGSSFGAEVKVTTASGMLVRELSSLGGTAVWDGRDVQGRVVSSGVYLIHILDPSGEVSGITKVAVESRR